MLCMCIWTSPYYITVEHAAQADQISKKERRHHSWLAGALCIITTRRKIIFEHQLTHNTTDTISDHLWIIVTMYGVMRTTMGSMELSCK